MKSGQRIQRLVILPVTLVALLAMLLVGWLLSDIKQEHDQVSAEQIDDLQAITLATGLGYRVGEINQRVTQSLIMAEQGERSALELYRLHTDITDELEVLSTDVAQLAESSLVQAVNHGSAQGLLDTFEQYRRFVIMSSDVVAVDPKVAGGYIDQAQAEFVQFSLYTHRITQLLADQAKKHNQTQSNAFSDLFEHLILTALFLLAGIWLLAYVVTRRVGLRLAAIANALGVLYRRAKDPEPVALPHMEKMAQQGKGEFAQMAETILTLRDALVRQRKAENQAFELTFYDPLTHLPNRRMLVERLGHAVRITTRRGFHGAVIWLDIDHFKYVNNLYGHQAGDQMLIELAGRLTETLGENDTVARLSGDEFVILLEALDTHLQTAYADIERTYSHVKQKLEQPMAVSNAEEPIQPSLSAGIVVFDQHTNEIEPLLKYAETAMYQSKEQGQGGYAFYDPDQQAEYEQRFTLERGLRQAIEQDQLQLFYQLQVDEHDQYQGTEALLRWIHPEQGMISPGLFIPLAEQSGLILPIGHWVLEQACKQLRSWAEHPKTASLSVAVNVSARQFRQPDFADDVIAQVKYHQIDPGLLKLELTESTVLEDVEGAIIKMRELRALGVKFSMDDFGTGYSSLQYLKRLPLDQIKIDQSFVRDVTEDEDDAVIVTTIIAMSHALGLEVIAEGVETREQQRFLQQHQCRLYQGFFYSKPLPIAELERALTA